MIVVTSATVSGASSRQQREALCLRSAAFAALLSGMFRSRISWPCDVRVKPRRLKYQEGSVLQQAKEHAKEHSKGCLKIHAEEHVKEHAKEHTQACLASATGPVRRQRPFRVTLRWTGGSKKF
jgi:hypothetical protein